MEEEIIHISDVLSQDYKRISMFDPLKQIANDPTKQKRSLEFKEEKKMECISELPDGVKYPLKKAASKYERENSEVANNYIAFLAGAVFVLNNPELIKNLK